MEEKIRKETGLDAVREKHRLTQIGKTTKMTENFSSKTMEVRGSRDNILLSAR